MTFADWWNENKDSIDVRLRPLVKRMAKSAWNEASAKDDSLATWDRLAGDEASNELSPLVGDEIGRAMSRVPPRTVEELIKRMNTLGGQCYLEHATMIREFFSRIERVRFLVRGVTLRQTAAAQLRALIIKVQKTLEEDTP